MSAAMISPPVGKQLDPTKSYLGLTPKQYAYCDARAAGATQIDAYRQAYDSQVMTDDEIHTAAWRLEQDARIPLRINNLLALKRQPSTVVRPEGEQPYIPISKDWVLQGIANIAIDKTVKAQTRLSAYVAVGKSAGIDAFRDVIVHEKRTRTVEEIDAEIARLISAQGSMIDVTPNQALAPAVEHSASAKDRRRKPIA